MNDLGGISSFYVIMTACFVIVCILLIIVVSYGIHLINKQKKKTLDSIQRIEYNSRMLELVDTTIKLEVVDLLKYSLMLNEKYQLKNIDDDIKKISDNVYNAFKTDIFEEPDNLYRKEYLFRYIIHQSTLMLHTYLKKENVVQ